MSPWTRLIDQQLGHFRVTEYKRVPGAKLPLLVDAVTLSAAPGLAPAFEGDAVAPSSPESLLLRTTDEKQGPRLTVLSEFALDFGGPVGRAGVVEAVRWPRVSSAVGAWCVLWWVFARVSPSSWLSTPGGWR